MGDRANVYIRQSPKTGVYLYTHWCGSELPEIVREAIASPEGRGRWQDDAYLARIIFCHMVGRENWSEETGFGISAHLCDNEYPIIVVDCREQRIGLASEPTDDAQAPTPATWQSFKDYCNQEPAAWPDRDAS